MGEVILVLAFSVATDKYNLPAGLLESICYVESGHDVQAYHENDGDGNSVGLCQIKLKTAKWLGFEGSEQDLLKPDVNIEYAARYLKYQITRYNSVKRGVIAYNVGNARGLEETSYSRKVFDVYENKSFFRKGIYYAERD